jgi:hypothetical protein
MSCGGPPLSGARLPGGVSQTMIVLPAKARGFREKDLRDLQVPFVQDLENVRKDNQKAGDKKDQPNARGWEKDSCKQNTKNQSRNDPCD